MQGDIPRKIKDTLMKQNEGYEYVDFTMRQDKR